MKLGDTLPLVGGLVAVGTMGFIVGWQWPRTPPPIVMTKTPAQAELSLGTESGQITGVAPPETTLTLGEQTISPGEAFSQSLDEAFPLRWWSDSWAIVLSAPDDLEMNVNKMHSSDEAETQSAPVPTEKSKGPLVASKSGTKYHPAEGCSFVARIKPENLIYFQTPAEAEEAGYEPSSCFKE
jgi:hypothetical protein